MKTKTHIDQVIQEGVTNKQTIMNLFGLSELEYNTRLFECGMNFLDVLFPAGTEFGQFQSMHSREKLFWSWFRVSYEFADRTYLKMLSQPIVDPNQSFETKWSDGKLETSIRVHLPKPRLENYDHLITKLITENALFQESFKNYLNTLKRNEKTMLPG